MQPSIDSRIPQVSMSGWRQGKPQNDPDRVQALGDAISRFGFVILTDVGSDAKRFGQYYDVVRDLFDLGPEVLGQYQTPENGRQTGYTPQGAETSKGHKIANQMQFWQVRRPDNAVPNLWVPEKPRFKEEALWMFGELDSLSHPIFDMLARYAGMPPDYFTSWLDGGDSLLRIIDYPEPEDEEDQAKPGSGHHEDICLGTFLVPDNEPGLEILSKDHGWIPVRNPPGTVIFNTGDMMSVHCNWHPDWPSDIIYPSTTHQVRRTKNRRDSSPLFAHPRGNVELLPGMLAEYFLARRLGQIYEDMGKAA